jgi:DNA (cytosine-5)-methyltransferase 1
MMAAYYNENDPFAAAWLRELIRVGAITPGDVDERDVLDVVPAELAGYRQCHFFAGVGVWSYALRLAGWPDDRPVWTGSCPCQPFSAAGKRGGFADERHLWPAWHHLIRQRRPAAILGEQVAGTDGLLWLDLVQTDLEDADYACGAVDLCAAGVGAPHIRQRLWWVAQRLADADDARLEGRRQPRRERVAERFAGQGGLADRLADADRWGRGECTQQLGDQARPGQQTPQRDDAGGCSGHGRPRPTDGFWGDADWLHCRDGKWRPVEPGTFPLASGVTGRVGRLRGYGNALNAEVAKVFIQSAMKVI